MILNRCAPLLVLVVLSASIAATAETGSQLQIWAVDPLDKVFRDATPAAGTEALAEVACGETASFQIVVRSDTPVSGLRVTQATFLLESTPGVARTPNKPRFVGYVPVDRPTQTPSKDQLRKPPADYPDPLLEDDTIDLPAGQAQPIWISVPVPVQSAAGTYRGSIQVSGRSPTGVVQAEFPLVMRVFRAVIWKSRLWVTNWFQMQWQHMSVKPEPDSPEYWDLLGRYARNMAEHRQNAALISPLSLAEFKAGGDGKLQIDFSRFDRWVQIFKNEGVIGLIEGGHLGGRVGAWESQFVVQIRQVKEGKVVASSVDPASPEADVFHAQFLPALVGHLKEKGWTDIYVQHLADEPIKENIATYQAIAALVRKYAPGMKIIEACHTKDLVGSVDVWVPQLNYLHNDFRHYQDRQNAGEQVWFYTCVFPQGEYANRFIEQPLIKTRLLHWINYRYGITGYLHWGYNWWTADDPFKKVTRDHGGPPYLPAGDAWIVYPGKTGPLDSIRFEAMRDGIADYELLCKLAEKDPESAKALVARHVLDFDKYETDVRAFRATRRELLEKLSK